MQPRDTQSTEIIGRSYLISQLVRDGLEVARPERDRGVDLITYLDLDEAGGGFVACPIQLKAATSQSFGIASKYAKFDRMLFAYVWHLDEPDKSCAYALTYDESLAIATEMGWTETASWAGGIYSSTKVSGRLLGLLEPHLMGPGDWKRKVRDVGSQLSRPAGVGGDFDHGDDRPTRADRQEQRATSSTAEQTPETTPRSGDERELRRSLVEPGPEVHLALESLGRVTDLLVAGDPSGARAELATLNEGPLRSYWASKQVRGISRPKAVGKRQKLSEADHDAVLARDGWHCRYCGIGVIDRKARRQIVAMLGDPPVWGGSDSQRHAALLVLSGVADHVEAATSFSDPALADSHDNLVASCYTCNFGKSSFSCDQLGLQDPRQHPAVIDSWDGLTRIIG